MKKCTLHLAVGALVFLATSQTLSAAPCGSGTLAQIVNTTCSIGNLSFTFSNFNSFVDHTDLNNNYVRSSIDPSSILFQSVVNGNSQGIALTPNWSDAPSSNQWFYSGHGINFYYTVTALNGTGIIGQSDQIVGSIGNASDTGSISSFDQQNYYLDPWCCGFAAYTSVNYTNNLGSYNEPYLAVSYSDFGVGPQFASDPTNPGWHALNSFAYTTQTATLQSETFLYYTQSATPEPSTAVLTLTGLAGAVAVFRRRLSL